MHRGKPITKLREAQALLLERIGRIHISRIKSIVASTSVDSPTLLPAVTLEDYHLQTQRPGVIALIAWSTLRCSDNAVLRIKHRPPVPGIKILPAVGKVVSRMIVGNVDVCLNLRPWHASIGLARSQSHDADCESSPGTNCVPVPINLLDGYILQPPRASNSVSS